jgi:hypothetical protein
MLTIYSNYVLLEVKDFSYFCCNCIDNLFDVCEFKSHNKPWKLATLEPCQAYNIHCDVDLGTTTWSREDDANFLVFDLIIGDNFLMLVDLNNFEGLNFFLLQCVKHMEIV